MGEWLIILLIAGPAALGQSYFVYRYLRYASWSGDRIGRALAVKSSALALLVDVALISTFVDVYGSSYWQSVAEITEVWVYFIATIGIWWQLIVLLKVQHAAKKREQDQEQ